MIGAQASAQISNFVAYAGRIGVELPDGLADELQQIDDTLARTTPDPGMGLSEAVWQAAAAGRDPADDEAVRRALVCAGLGGDRVRGLNQRFAAPAKARAFDRHADGLFAQLVEVVDAASDVIDAARAAVPGLNLDEPTQPSHLSPSAASAWVEASNQLRRVGEAVTCWTHLGQLTGAVRRGRPETKALVVADLDLDEFETLTRRTSRPTHTDVVALGFPLSLATPEGFVERKQKLNEQRAARQRHLEEQTRQAFGRRSVAVAASYL